MRRMMQTQILPVNARSLALAKEISHVDGDETTEEEDGGTPGGV